MHRNDSAGPDRIHPEEALSRTLGAYFDRPVRREHSLPAGTWRIDGVISLVGVDCDGLGPLGRFLANRLVAVEFFSRAPRLVLFRRAIIKGMWLQASEKTADLATASLILTEGEPAKALRVEEFAPWASVQGVWIRQREAFRVAVVDTRRIQGLPGWTLWPLLRSIELVRADDLRAFAEDETIKEERRRRVMGVIEELADKAGRVDLRQVGFEVGLAEGKRRGFDEGLAEGKRRGFDEGKRRGFDEGLAEGKRRGFDEGLAEGKRRGFDEGLAEGKRRGFDKGLAEGKRQGFDEGQREALLGLARTVLDPDTVRELEAIDDTETLRRRIEASLGRSAER